MALVVAGTAGAAMTTMAPGAARATVAAGPAGTAVALVTALRVVARGRSAIVPVALVAV